jgi:hypothetical protein
MSAIEAFSQWYTQLSASDQYSLCASLRAWLNQAPSPAGVRKVQFGGKSTIPVTARTVGGIQTVQCQRCGFEMGVPS